ncbi:MAG: hypothetical protein ACHRHE_22350 [Tepidisphaerales bacterium]
MIKTTGTAMALVGFAEPFDKQGEAWANLAFAIIGVAVLILVGRGLFRSRRKK